MRRTDGLVALIVLISVVVITLMLSAAHADGVKAGEVKLAELSPGVGLHATVAQATAKQAAPAPVRGDWKWRLEPCLGAGTTMFKGFNATVSVGAVLGTVPAETPILGGHDFGGLFVQVNGEPGGGPFVNLVGPLDLAFLCWRGQKVEGDLALMVRKSFTF